MGGGTRKRSFESLARVISVDVKRQTQKWSRHGGGDGNSKSEHREQMLPACEHGEGQKMEQRQEKSGYLILPSFSSFALSGKPTSDLKTKVCCSHEVSLCVALCPNSCLWQCSFGRLFHLRAPWPWSRQWYLGISISLFLPSPRDPPSLLTLSFLLKTLRICSV